MAMAVEGVMRGRLDHGGGLDCFPLVAQLGPPCCFPFSFRSMTFPSAVSVSLLSRSTFRKRSANRFKLCLPDIISPNQSAFS